MNVYLSGLIGSGKTTLGRRLADRLGRSFLDLDRELDADLGRSFHELVREEGWLADRFGAEFDAYRARVPRYPALHRSWSD